MVRGLTGLRSGGAASEAAWTDLGGGAVLLHAGSGPDPQIVGYCRELAAWHEPTLVFVDLPAGVTVRDRDGVASFLAGQPGVLRVVPVRSGASAAVSLAERLSHLLGRIVLAPEGQPVEVSGGLFVPVDAGGGWLRFEPGRVPVAASRRLPTPVWESAWFAEERDLGGGVRVEPLPAGVWITAPGAPRVADSYRKWLISGLAMDPTYPRVVIGHPGPMAVPLDAIGAFWQALDDEVRRVVRFAGFGVTEPKGVALGQLLADRFGVAVVAGTGVPVLAPSGTGGSRIRTLLNDGAMHWQPYVWDARYFPQAVDGASDPQPVGHRPPIEGLVEVAPGVYEYAPDAVLEVTPSGLMMRPPGDSAHAAAVRGVGPEPDRARVFHAADEDADAERMRALAGEVVGRLEAEVRESCEVLPSTAALGLVAAVAEVETQAVDDEAVAAAVGEAAFVAEAVAELEAVLEPAVVGDAEAVVEEGAFGAEAVAELEAVLEPEVVGDAEAVVEEAAFVAEAVAELEAVLEPAVVGDAEAVVEAEPDIAAEPESVAEVAELPEAEPDTETEAAAQPAVAALPSIAGIQLESGPSTFDLPLAAQAPAFAQAVIASPAVGPAAGQPQVTVAPKPVIATVSELPAPATVAVAEPVITAIPTPVAQTPAPVRRLPTAKVQPVPRPETAAIPTARSLDKERQWLRRTLSEQYDATVGSVSRVLSESPGLRTGGSSTADVLVDLVAVHLYLAGQTRRFDDLVRSGAAGPHVPLARCIASGLKRLPSHRGAAMTRVTLTEQEIGWYDGRSLVTEWAFAPCLASGRFRVPGEVDVLVWSMTARRTQVFAPELPEQVVFLPGTSFKVLSVATDGRTRVLLRELSASEVGPDGRVAPGRVPLDDVALGGLAAAGEAWLGTGPQAELPASCADRFGNPFGLLAQAGLAAAAASAGRPDPRAGRQTAAAGASAAPTELEGRAS